MKVNKKLIRLLLVFITLFTITTSVYAIDPNSYITGENKQQETTTEETQQENVVLIEDDADILTDQEEALLISKMGALKTEGNVVFKTITENDKSAKEYATEYYEGKYGQNSGVIILFDFKNGSVYLLSRGEVGQKFTNEQAQEIIDTGLEQVKNKQYYDGAANMFSKLEEILGITTAVEEDQNGNTLLIEDDANLLKPEEIEKLKERMKPLTKYGHIVFKSISTNPKGSTQSFANDFYYSKFGNESVTIFIIDMDTRHIYIVSAG